MNDPTDCGWCLKGGSVETHSDNCPMGRAEPTMIAIVPTEQWREALIGAGPGPDCGQVPPCIWGYVGGPYHPVTDDDVDLAPIAPLVFALPLLWRSTPVPDGIARAIHALLAVGSVSDGDLGQWMWEPGSREVERLARALKSYGIAAEVIVEVSDE